MVAPSDWAITSPHIRTVAIGFANLRFLQFAAVHRQFAFYPLVKFCFPSTSFPVPKVSSVESAQTRYYIREDGRAQRIPVQARHPERARCADYRYYETNPGSLRLTLCM